MIKKSKTRNTKPVPVQIKILRGTYRKDRDGDKIALTMPKLETLPPVPEGFDDGQAELWNTICRILHAIGILQPVGLVFIRIYCEQWRIYQEARKHIEKEGNFLTREDGITYKNPSLSIMKISLGIMRQIADNFGFSPLSQSRIKTF